MNIKPIPRPLRSAGLALLLASTATTAIAQYAGPGARAPTTLPLATTVAEVLRDATDDRPVELTGNLVEQTGRELYLFRDDTGEITVEIDSEDFPANQQIGPDVLVKISGEVEARLMRKPRVEVERLQLAPAAQ